MPLVPVPQTMQQKHSARAQRHATIAVRRSVLEGLTFAKRPVLQVRPFDPSPPPPPAPAPQPFGKVPPPGCFLLPSCPTVWGWGSRLGRSDPFPIYIPEASWLQTHPLIWSVCACCLSRKPALLWDGGGRDPATLLETKSIRSPPLPKPWPFCRIPFGVERIGPTVFPQWNHLLGPPDPSPHPPHLPERPVWCLRRSQEPSEEPRRPSLLGCSLLQKPQAPQIDRRRFLSPWHGHAGKELHLLGARLARGCSPERGPLGSLCSSSSPFLRQDTLLPAPPCPAFLGNGTSPNIPTPEEEGGTGRPASPHIQPLLLLASSGWGYLAER